MILFIFWFLVIVHYPIVGIPAIFGVLGEAATQAAYACILLVVALLAVSVVVYPFV